MPRVNIPHVGVVNFPDNMPHAEIRDKAAHFHRIGKLSKSTKRAGTFSEYQNAAQPKPSSASPMQPTGRPPVNGAINGRSTSQFQQ
jgi:hypothetical protein